MSIVFLYLNLFGLDLIKSDSGLRQRLTSRIGNMAGDLTTGERSEAIHKDIQRWIVNL